MNKKEVKAWIKEHKGLLIGIGVGTVCVAGTIIGIKCIPKKSGKFLPTVIKDSDCLRKLGKENAKIIDEQVYCVLAPNLEDLLLHGSGDCSLTQDFMLDNGIRKLVEVTVKES